MMRGRVSFIIVTIGLGLLCSTAAVRGAAEAKTLTAAEAAQHVGEVAKVCGVVASAKFSSSSAKQPTFINLDKPYPGQIFTVLIWGSDRAAFGQPEVTYNGKRICATGKIQLYKGKPEIIATTPSQIEMVNLGETPTN
jgi:DNA/RNA endonuclease YhcR with UshA esterase domain